MGKKGGSKSSAGAETPGRGGADGSDGGGDPAGHSPRTEKDAVESRTRAVTPPENGKTDPFLVIPTLLMELLELSGKSPAVEKEVAYIFEYGMEALPLINEKMVPMVVQFLTKAAQYLKVEVAEVSRAELCLKGVRALVGAAVGKSKVDPSGVATSAALTEATMVWDASRIVREGSPLGESVSVGKPRGSPGPPAVAGVVDAAAPGRVAVLQVTSPTGGALAASSPVANWTGEKETPRTVARDAELALSASKDGETLAKLLREKLTAYGSPFLEIKSSPELFLLALRDFRHEVLRSPGDEMDLVAIKVAVGTLPQEAPSERHAWREWGQQVLERAIARRESHDSLLRAFEEQVRLTCSASKLSNVEEHRRFFAMTLQPGASVQSFLDRLWALGRSLKLPDEFIMDVALVCLGAVNEASLRTALETFVAKTGGTATITDLKTVLKVEYSRFGVSIDGRWLGPRGESREPVGREGRKAGEASKKTDGVNRCYQCDEPGWTRYHVCGTKGTKKPPTSASGQERKPENGKSGPQGSGSATSSTSGTPSVSHGNSGSKDSRPKGSS